MAAQINGSTGINLIQDGIVSESKIASGAVTVNKIGTGAVNSSKIADNGVDYIDLPSGSILQTVYNQTQAHPYFSTTSTSLVSTGFSLSITPKYSNSKLLVSGAVQVNVNGSMAAMGGGLALYRDGVNLTPSGGASGNFGFYYQNTTGDMYQKLPFTFYLNANSTTTTTFVLYMRSWTGSAVAVNLHDGTTEITIMEIKG